MLMENFTQFLIKIIQYASLIEIIQYASLIKIIQYAILIEIRDLNRNYSNAILFKVP